MSEDLHVVGHLEADNDDAEVDFLGTLAQGVRAHEFVETADLRIIVGRVIFVLAFAFTHFWVI